MSWLVFIIYPPIPTEAANLTTRTKRQCETTTTPETPTPETTTTPPPLFHLPRVQTRAGSGLFSGFNAASTASTLPRILTRARGGPLWSFNTSATTTTSLASKRETEVDLSMVSTPLPPLPPPSHSNASRRWIFYATTCLGGYSSCGIIDDDSRGGVKPTHRRVRMFPCSSGLLGRRVTSPPCLTPPNNNEGSLRRRR